MKYFILSLTLLTFCVSSWATTTETKAQVSAEKKQEKARKTQQAQSLAVVNGLVDAYNNKDIDEFITYFSEDVAFYMFPNELMFRGKEQLIARYAVMFKALKCIKSTSLNRIVHDHYVIDQELSESCTNDPEVVDKRSQLVTTYYVKNGKVSKVMFLRNEPKANEPKPKAQSKSEG